MSMEKTYSSKSNAKRAAKSAGYKLEDIVLFQTAEGRWYYAEAEEEFDVIGGYSHCPHCEIHLSNGVLVHSDNPNQGENLNERQFYCMACNSEFGPKIAKPVEPVEPAKPEVKGKGLKIEKDRPEQNGITRPSIGGKCRAVWDYCDMRHADGVIPMPKEMKRVAAEKGWNPNNAVIEMYQWRKFNGITGRKD